MIAVVLAVIFVFIEKKAIAKGLLQGITTQLRYCLKG
jgi:hypothetical protein